MVLVEKWERKRLLMVDDVVFDGGGVWRGRCKKTSSSKRNWVITNSFVHTLQCLLLGTTMIMVVFFVLNLHSSYFCRYERWRKAVQG